MGGKGEGGRRGGAGGKENLPSNTATVSLLDKQGRQKAIEGQEDEILVEDNKLVFVICPVET